MTPRVSGLTVLDAQGVWRDDRQMRERTKLVIIVLPDESAAREQIAGIAATYKTRFHQKSVGVVTQASARRLSDSGFGVFGSPEQGSDDRENQNV